jgi:hypothetical protein
MCLFIIIKWSVMHQRSTYKIKDGVICVPRERTLCQQVHSVHPSAHIVSLWNMLTDFGKICYWNQQHKLIANFDFDQHQPNIPPNWQVIIFLKKMAYWQKLVHNIKYHMTNIKCNLTKKMTVQIQNTSKFVTFVWNISLYI